MKRRRVAWLGTKGLSPAQRKRTVDTTTGAWSSKLRPGRLPDMETKVEGQYDGPMACTGDRCPSARVIRPKPPPSVFPAKAGTFGVEGKCRRNRYRKSAKPLDLERPKLEAAASYRPSYLSPFVGTRLPEPHRVDHPLSASQHRAMVSIKMARRIYAREQPHGMIEIKPSIAIPSQLRWGPCQLSP